MCWLMVNTAVGKSSSVYPSGRARETCSAPMLPPAPGRFSTMTDWPRTSPSFAAIGRAERSVVPPGG
jgi:hypothetical protein